MSDYTKFRTVKELMEFLATVPPDSEVSVYSCCDSVTADEVRYYPPTEYSNGHVQLTSEF